MTLETVRRRLQEAALELFQEHGYDRTTAADIAARVGVTERTFFRYFPSKRDVLFDEAALHDGLDVAIADAPDGLAPMKVLQLAFQALVPLFEANRSLTEPARDVVARTPALLERHLAKSASITSAVASALQRRGLEADLAALAAASGMAVIGQALQSWFIDPSGGLTIHLGHAFNVWDTLAGSGQSAHA